MSDTAHTDRGPSILALSVTLIVLTTAAVALRFLSRRLAGARFWWDDWLSLAALPWVIGCSICNIYSLHLGFGQHVALLPIDTTQKFLQVSYYYEIIYVLGISISKYSILLSYRRIFPQRTLKIVLWVVASVVLMWQISVFFSFVFQCVPASKSWVYLTPGTCLNLNKVFLGSAITNIITDFVIIIIPLPLIWRIQIPKSQRIALCCIFLTGGFVCAISLARLYFLVHLSPYDLTWNQVDLASWSAVEPSIGLVCACLPSMRILLTRLSIFVSSHVGASAKRLSRDGGNSSSSGMLHNSNNNTNNWTRKLLGANHQQQQSNSTGEGQGQKSSGRLNDRGGECTRGDDVRRSVAPRLGEVEMVVPMGRIHVTRQVELTESWEGV